ncbi:hypothetical protein M3J09_006249 [Ascochyta lentis]
MPGPSRKYSWWLENRSLYSLLSKFRASEASDSRDLIYALLGISSDACATELLEPDYSKSEEDVIYNTLVFLAVTHGSKQPVASLPRWTSLKTFRLSLDSLSDYLLGTALRPRADPKKPSTRIEEESPGFNDYPYRTVSWPDPRLKSFPAGVQEDSLQFHEFVFGSVPLLKTLQTMGEIDAGCTNVDDKDLHGRTPLARAACSGELRLIHPLLNSAEADINSQDWLGQTPLSIAAKNGHDLVVRSLIKKAQIDINLRDCRGRTPLAWAAERGHDATVVYILQQSARIDDVDSRDESGWTAISLATENMHDRIVTALTTHGAGIHSSWEQIEARALRQTDLDKDVIDQQV